uniref:Uncharacterized protein n=1 Tax=Heliothis virescens TaxID=7102 RepID=A0A2A4JJM7_HELVI
MRLELPECKRCCFCLPLRHSLITWGYIRLVISVFNCINLLVLFYRMIESLDLRLLFGFLIICTLTDIVLNAMFIIGGHRKNPKLLKAYYVYSCVLCVLTTLTLMPYIYALCTYMQIVSDIKVMFYVYTYYTMNAMVLVSLILTQIYITLLVRSEMVKLRNNCEFRFQNLTPEPQCTMKCEHSVTCEDQVTSERNDAEKGTE